MPQDENLPIKREIPACCLTCGHYQPQFYRIIGIKECAAFGSIDGVKWDMCGAWCKRVQPPKFG